MAKKAKAEAVEVAPQEEVVVKPTPVKQKPKAVDQGNHYPDGRKKYEWFNGWTDEELCSAEYLGVFHREDKRKDKPICAAVDFDE